MLRLIDSYLNSITMYRLVLYSLAAIVAAAFGLSALGYLSFNLASLLLSLIVLSSSCFLSNQIFSRIFRAVINHESSAITALILFLIWFPSANWSDVPLTFGVGIAAMGSKYVLAIGRKHLFNPVAAALVLLGLLGVGNSIWWVGSSVLLPVVSIVGLLVVRKIRRLPLFLSFLTMSLVTVSINQLMSSGQTLSTLVEVFTSWPILFFGTFMLTEPLTTPPHRHQQVLYGGLVGMLFSLQFHWGPGYSTPELALVLGNLFSYVIGPKQKLWLHLLSSKSIAKDMYEFSFRLEKPFTFKAGQYLEWTLPHVQLDSRGNRRYFTIASSPTESDIKLGVKIEPARASRFKTALLKLQPGEVMIGAQLSGDFCLPADPTQKLVFIAGGIGITPFRSMIKYLLDTQTKVALTLYYTVSHPNELAYEPLFNQAKKQIGLQYRPVVTRAENAPSKWPGLVGRLTAEQIKSDLPDYLERRFYLSGPNAMVHAYQAVLKELGVPNNQVITDYFPGF